MLRKRGNTFWIHRRVPKLYSEVEPREQIRESLHTDSEKEAKRKAEALWKEYVAAWELKLDGKDEDAIKRLELARMTARRIGVQYLPYQEVVQLPVEDRVARVLQAEAGPDEAVAALGAAPIRSITVSEALEGYWELAADKAKRKTDDQVRRWKNPLKRAINEFVEQIGDRQLTEITRTDMLQMRAFLWDRVEADEIIASTANKYLTHFTQVIRLVNDLKGLELTLPFDKLRFKEDEKIPRPPFSVAWIRDKILAPDALGGLNDEARNILIIMINTGARPSEIAGLMTHHLDLQSNLPVMRIRAEGRQLKNKNSGRDMPLTGVSLEAARDAFSRAAPRIAEAAKGETIKLFPRYFGADKLSAVLNKYMRENGLLELTSDGRETSLYSLRHSFEDRMIQSGVDERVRSDLFGHSIARERYGTGGGPEVRHEAVARIAL